MTRRAVFLLFVFLAMTVGVAGTASAQALRAEPRTGRADAATTMARSMYDVGLQHAQTSRASATNLAAGSADRSQVNRGSELPLASGIAAEDAGGASNTLFHYTTVEGQKGILDSGQRNPSLKSVNPSDARYGNGQYLSDIAPGTKTGAQLSRSFINNPFQGARFTNYVEIDTSGLNVVQGRAGVFVIPGETPLDLTGRIVSWGTN